MQKDGDFCNSLKGSYHRFHIHLAFSVDSVVGKLYNKYGMRLFEREEEVMGFQNHRYYYSIDSSHLLQMSDEAFAEVEVYIFDLMSLNSEVLVGVRVVEEENLWEFHEEI